MKKLLIPICICLLVITTATAQQQKTGKPHHKEHNRKELVKKLNLTPTQQTQVKTINQNFKEKTKALKANDNMTLGEFKKQQQDLKQQRKAAFTATLTAQQKATLEQEKINKQAEKKERMAAHFEKMKTKLALTQQQEAQIKTKQSEIQQQVDVIKNNNNLSQQQKREQIKALKENQKSYLKSLLTVEQLQKLEQRKRVKK